MDLLRTLKSSATKRIALGFLMTGVVSADRLKADDERWTVSFLAEGQGVGSAAVAFQGAKGPVLVTIALQGGDLSKSRVQLGNQQMAAKLVGYDAVSRLCFFRPADGTAIIAPEWQKNTGVRQGGILSARSGKIEVLGKMEGWVHQVGGKVLPLALMKVGFGGSSPPPGTPLLDESGKVAAVAFQTSQTEPCVYAIPAKAVHRVSRDISQNGRFVRGWLGLSLRVENESPKIVRVIPGSPAGTAGIRENDVISKIGGDPVSSYAEVVNAFFYVVPGEPVDIEVKRGEDDLVFALMPAAEKPGN